METWFSNHFSNKTGNLCAYKEEYFSCISYALNIREPWLLCCCLRPARWTWRIKWSLQKWRRRIPAFPRCHRLSNKRPNSRCGVPLFQLLVSVIPKIPQTMQVIGITLGYPSEKNGETWLLKSLHNWVIEHGEIKLGPTWIQGFKVQQCESRTLVGNHIPFIFAEILSYIWRQNCILKDSSLK